MSTAEVPRMVDVAVVGGGPVGLFLGVCLARLGLSFVVLERTAGAWRHSRAIGIHPVSLELFEPHGLTGPFVRAGVRVPRGVAFGARGLLGEVSFERVHPRYPFVLSLPQYDTERLLEAKLRELTGRADGALRREVTVRGLQVRADGATVSFENERGAPEQIRARFVVGADGGDSVVRAHAGMRVDGVDYPDTYLMGDFPDTTAYGAAAAVHLTPGGVVESFPLPGNLRRWVARTDELLDDAESRDLDRLVRERTGHALPAGECRMLSAFRAERRLARRFRRGPVVLAGDAAHTVSPIGGQGLNLGWLDAALVARAVRDELNGAGGALDGYAGRARRTAVLASRLAEANMALGRATRLSGARDGLVRALLRGRAADGLAWVYAMRWAHVRPEDREG